MKRQNPGYEHNNGIGRLTIDPSDSGEKNEMI